MDMSMISDFKLESLELEMNLVIGVSIMIMDTWQAASPRQGLLWEVGDGRVMFTKFWNVRFFIIDLGKEATTLY